MKAAHETFLLFAYSSLFILVLQRCVANAKPYCTPSACGIISDISYPFRLKGDPNYCGDRRTELACENNVTFFYLNSHKYYVKAINYDFTTITLVDSSINGDTCSFPTYSVFSDSLTYTPYSIIVSLGNSLINMMSCSHPLKNSSTFTNTTHCQTSNSRFTYIKIGHLNASDVTETCRVDVITKTSWRGFKDLNNSVSLQEIHRSLLYGFEIFFCVDCIAPIWTASAWENFTNFVDQKLRVPLTILIAIAVLTGALVNPIIGVAVASGILLYIGIDLYVAFARWSSLDVAPYTVIGDIISIIRYEPWRYGMGMKKRGMIPKYLGITKTLQIALTPKMPRRIVIIFGPRFIISLFLALFFIRKFRRRHLSRFDIIESFLGSDNKLVPIRYSYSDIKRMTKNFQDKLGEGGYGSVYKGKLRSGNHVAVKLLGKSGSNDQDFMNEISTIGRIHHVNIAKLVGYCAEGSKRALVLDYMSNGSLEKYIFNKEKMDSLNWDTKFEIVIGVARGIEYLHQGCNIQILHFDIKPHNILLNDNFIPKVSDFGLAKFFSTDKNTMTLTAARGTIGYVAPELINRGIGRVSYKADVYSYGMLLMEMVGLNRDWKGNDDDSNKYFPQCIYDRFNQDKEFKVGSVDEIENDCDNESTRALVRKMTIVALWCIQMNPDDRPSMNKVLEMLEGEVGHLQIPPYPLEYPNVIVNKDETWGTSSTYSDSVSQLHYKNAADVEIIIEDFPTLP